MYKILIHKKAEKDKAKIEKNKALKNSAEKILKEIAFNPYSYPTKKLSGNLEDYYSRRINIQHRLVFEVNEENKTILILKMWSHYEKL